MNIRISGNIRVEYLDIKKNPREILGYPGIHEWNIRISRKTLEKY